MALQCIVPTWFADSAKLWYDQGLFPENEFIFAINFMVKNLLARCFDVAIV